MLGWVHAAVVWLFCSLSKGRAEMRWQHTSLCPANPRPWTNVSKSPLLERLQHTRVKEELTAVGYPVFALQKDHPLQQAANSSFQGTDPDLGVLKPS